MRYAKQRVYLVRHGETAWSVSRQHTGSTDIPLTPHGREIAARLAPVLSEAEFAEVLVSPLQRARDTCELAGFGARAHVEQALCEWNYGRYEGLTPEQILAQDPEWLIFRDGCPGGESPAQIGARVDWVIGKVRAVPGHVVLFSHGHFLRALAAGWLGMPVSAGCHFMLDTATVSVLSYYHDVGAIERWNMGLATAGVSS
ncbi:MAG: histidine phosphatase family protein [Steroidobacteraceae bacterium]